MAKVKVFHNNAWENSGGGQEFTASEKTKLSNIGKEYSYFVYAAQNVGQNSWTAIATIENLPPGIYVAVGNGLIYGKGANNEFRVNAAVGDTNGGTTASRTEWVVKMDSQYRSRIYSMGVVKIINNTTISFWVYSGQASSVTDRELRLVRIGDA